MTAQLIEGTKVATGVEAELRGEIEALARVGVTPGLVAVRVGDDPASEVYVRSKERKARELGLHGRQEHYPATIPQRELLDIVRRLNQDDSVDGILVQLPLPGHIDSESIINAIDPRKDVDGFHPMNVGRLQLGKSALVPCTPLGVVRLIESTGVDIRGKHAVIIGRSQIVGRPAAALLLQRDATITICHSRTADIGAITRQADILVAAVGRPFFVTGEMVREGAIVIDVGINRITADDPAASRLTGDSPKKKTLAEKGRVLVGDVDFDAARERAAWITPVPGGVGPMTIAMLMSNTVQAARERRG